VSTAPDPAPAAAAPRAGRGGGRRVRLLVLFGGRSTEHSISCVSAGSVLAAVDRDRYHVVPVGIRRDGAWVLAPDDPGALAIRDGVLPEVPDGPRVVLAPDPTVGGLLVGSDGAVVGVDVVFPVLHGPYGEDGTVQGLLEMAGIPYVGSGVLASAAGMDKQHMKSLLAAAGLPVAPAEVVTAEQWRADPDAVRERVARLGLPVFTKPARGGSSVGISKVTASADLDAALETALADDPKALVEAAVVGREVECAVVAGADGGPAEASVPGEIRVLGRDWYDFEAKYLDDATELDVPARLPAEVTQRLRAQALVAFAALECEGLARVDFFVCEDGSLVINEVNTMPGFTPTSMYPRMWAATGLSYPDLVDRLVGSALATGTGLR
jgi:D-alanine-D-alanine ligase